jgi:hypothetical protein
MSKLAYAAVFAAASTLLASGASANPVNFTVDGTLFGSGSAGVTVTAPSGTQGVMSGGTQGVNAGAFHVKDTISGDSFIAWCVDLLDTLSTPTLGVYTATATPFSDPWSILPATQNVIKSLFDTSYAIALNSATNSAAFQLALWEIVYENPANGWGVSSGSGQFFTTTSGAVANAANTMLAGLGGTPTGNFNVTYWQSNTVGKQDLVTVSEVPLPAAVWLFGSGLVGLGILSRKRRKAAEAVAA